MITASEARTQALKGDPERMLIIAETKIKDAAANKQRSCLIKYSKHLYGMQDISNLCRNLGVYGYLCLPKFTCEGNNFELEVRW